MEVEVHSQWQGMPITEYLLTYASFELKIEWRATNFFLSFIPPYFPPLMGLLKEGRENYFWLKKKRNERNELCEEKKKGQTTEIAIK